MAASKTTRLVYLTWLLQRCHNESNPLSWDSVRALGPAFGGFYDDHAKGAKKLHSDIMDLIKLGFVVWVWPQRGGLSDYEELSYAMSPMVTSEQFGRMVGGVSGELQVREVPENVQLSFNLGKHTNGQ